MTKVYGFCQWFELDLNVASGVASGPAVPPGGTNNFKKNDEMFYSEAKITALLILKI
jgi:hypothetical protein